MPSLKIGIDARPLVGVRTGVGRYVWELCRALDDQLPDATYFLYSHRPIDPPVLSRRWMRRVDESLVARSLRGIPWLKLRAGSLIRRDGIDVFWATSGLLPRLDAGVWVVSTVYDLNYTLVPETMPVLYRWALSAFFPRDVAQSHRVCSISSGTATRMRALLGIDSFAVVPPAASNTFRPQDRMRITAVLQRYGLRRPYFLSVATNEPRKNLPTLVQAFLTLQQEGHLSDHLLVLAGAAGWGRNRLPALLRGTKSVKSLGYVPDPDLPALYAGCEAFVFPSRYEGFGLPVLEARASGARIIATDIPEIREAGGEGAVYITPSVEGIRAALLACAENTTPRVRVEVRTSWADSARALATAFTRPTA